jgi:dipeptidase
MENKKRLVFEIKNEYYNKLNVIKMEWYEANKKDYISNEELNDMINKDKKLLKKVSDLVVAYFNELKKIC